MNLTFYPWFKLDALNGFMALAAGFFLLLTLIYSAGFMKGKKNLVLYYVCIVLAAFTSAGALLANDLFLLLVFWGFLGFILYLLINMGGEGASGAAKKSFIIVGGSDMLLLFGIALIYYITRTTQMDQVRLQFTDYRIVLAYLCIAIASFSKAGAMPFHSWIPDCAKSAPIPVVAYLPAALDKLLGIYLLARVSLHLFVMNEAMNSFLMIAGAFTIIGAVAMALVQHNIKKLLGFHAVSQVGYMVLGIGTANPIGIAGGIFHMFNNAVYKSCLFFSAGNVEHRMKTSEVDELGGLAKFMPITYAVCLIASLSISGVPPFNGFFSKWMIYQGLIQRLSFKQSPILTVFCLGAAMFGSALTLASFIKLIYAVYFRKYKRADTGAEIKEVPQSMWVPCVILAAVCVVFGIFAYQLPLRYFIMPIQEGVSFTGTWFAGASTLLIIAGLLLGVVVFRLKGIKPLMREDRAFIGGEEQDSNDYAVSGAQFYNTIKEIGILAFIYRKAEAGVFDIYEQGRRALSVSSRFFQYLHNGVLPSYLTWILLGMSVLLIICCQ